MKTTRYLHLLLLLPCIAYRCTPKTAALQQPPQVSSLASIQSFKNGTSLYSDWFRFVAGDWKDTVLPTGVARYAFKALPEGLADDEALQGATPLLFTRFTANAKAARLPLQYVSGANAQSLRLEVAPAKGGYCFIVTSANGQPVGKAAYGGELRYIIPAQKSALARSGVKYKELQAALLLPESGSNL